MYELVNKQFIEIKEYKGERVVTLNDIDTLHQRPKGTARRNFNENKNRLIMGVDYFVRNSYEAKKEFNIIAPNGLILLAESGYLMIVKSFTDELAWTVQRQLINAYFRARQQNNYSFDQTAIVMAIKELYEKVYILNKENHELKEQIKRLNHELNKSNREFTVIIKILCEKVLKLNKKQSKSKRHK